MFTAASLQENFTASHITVQHQSHWSGDLMKATVTSVQRYSEQDTVSMMMMLD